MKLSRLTLQRERSSGGLQHSEEERVLHHVSVHVEMISRTHENCAEVLVIDDLDGTGNSVANLLLVGSTIVGR